MEIKRILVIRFSSIGDIVLTTPIVRAIKKSFPQAELHYLTKPSNAILLTNNKYIDRVHVLTSDYAQMLKLLRSLEFDYVVDLQKNLRSGRIKRSLGVESSSFPKLNFKKWLFVRFKRQCLPSVHVVDRYFEAVKPIGVSNDGMGLDFFLQEEDFVSPDFLPLDFQNGYVACVVGSKHCTKQMPTDVMVSLCRLIQKPILLLGDDNDRDKAMAGEKTVGTKVFNACGAYNINQSAYLLKNSMGVITPDTGLMHIAAAFDKDIIVVWGNTVPAFGMYPYRAKNSKGKTYNFEVRDLKCRPCSKLGYDKCPKRHFKCMKRQDVNSMAEIANSWIEN